MNPLATFIIITVLPLISYGANFPLEFSAIQRNILQKHPAAYSIAGKLQFSRDGTTLIASGGTGVSVLNAKDLSIIKQIGSDHDFVYGLDVNHDGSIVFLGGLKNLKAVRIADSMVLWEVAAPDGSGLEFFEVHLAADQTQLMARLGEFQRFPRETPVDSSEIVSFSSDSGREVSRMSGEFLAQPQARVWGKYIGEGYVRLQSIEAPFYSAPIPFNLRSGPFIRPLNSAEFSKDGNQIVTAEARAPVIFDYFDPENRVVKLWRASDGALIRQFQGHSRQSTFVGFLPGDKVLVTAGVDALVGHGCCEASVRFWRVRDGLELLNYDGVGPTAMAISPDGSHIALAALAAASPSGESEADPNVYLIRTPVLVHEVLRLDGQIQIEWAGGSGTYQIQSSRDLDGSDWENVGGQMTGFVARINTQGSHTFLRVVSL